MKKYTDEEFKELRFASFEGNPELTCKLVSPGLVSMRYFNHEEQEIRKGSDRSDTDIKTHMFVCDVDGIDERLIRMVEFPKFDYADNSGNCYVKIYYYTVEQ
jgi:hypothetical protein